MVMSPYQEFLTHLPKAELHVHIEGTLEPELFLRIAQRNKVHVPSYLLDQDSRYVFTDFPSFIEAYTHVSAVLQTEQDYYDMVVAYLQKVSSQGTLHTEIFFDLQSHMLRGVPAATVINGLYQGIEDGKKQWGISGGLIMCFLRHLTEQDAFQALEHCIAHKNKILGVGLASLEDGNPAVNFKNVFQAAHEHGFHITAHAGESDIHNIRPSIEILHAERIDHGIQAIHDHSLILFLVERNIPLTVCPLSNLALGMVKRLEDHPLKKMIDAGLMVTINSDDPAFFGGYIAENYFAAATKCGLSLEDILQCARNSFTASFASADRKRECLLALNRYVLEWQNKAMQI